MTTRTITQAAAALAGNNGFSLISNEKLLELHTAMVKCRMIAERTRTAAKQDGVIAGHEAATVGATIDLTRRDTVFPARGDCIVNFIKGVRLSTIFGRLAAGTEKQDLATQMNLAIRAAGTSKGKKDGTVAVVFCDGESALTDLFDQTLTVAGAQQLPILFLSYRSLSTTRGSQNEQGKYEEMILKAQACGFPGIPVDGNDVVAVYRVATEAIAHARKGNGPTLIACMAERSKLHDPIQKMEAYLKRKGLFRKEISVEISAAFASDLDAAIKAVEAKTFSESN